MIYLKKPAEIAIMNEAGKKLADITAVLLEKIKPGVTGLEIENLAQKLIQKTGGYPSFQMVKGYKYATCICVNDIVVHGIPTQKVFTDQDLIGLDIGLYYQGYHADMSWSVYLGKNPAVFHFLETGKNALLQAISKIVPGNHIGDISHTIEKIITQNGYKPVRDLIGHGIGKKLHEEPEIPCFLRGKIENTPLIKKGMTLAIEVIYNQTDHRVVYQNDDGWTIVSRDGSLSGLFELTVAATSGKPQVLTISEKFAKMVKL